MAKIVTVAIIQHAPVYLDLAASVEKAVALTKEAAGKGARVVTFGETWLPGYPAWLDYCRDMGLWNHEPTKTVFARLRQNSVLVPGKETRLFGQLAAENNLILVMGVNERVESGPGNGTLYNSLLTFTPEGELKGHHRKLVPTYTERIVWGQGDGRGLEAVATPVGRIGGLICWEHWMPLARQALHDSGEAMHVAVWPTVHEMHQVASRHYGFEGRCFVLASGLIMRAKDLPAELQTTAEFSANPEAFVLHGGSAVIGPDGKYVVEPVYDREVIITAELDLEAVERERMTLDVSGHYSRPDIFSFKAKGILGDRDS